MSDFKTSSPFDRPTPDDLPAFVPYACKQLSSPFSVKFNTIIQEEYVSKADEKLKKPKKSMAVLTQMPVSDSKEESMGVVTNVSIMENNDIVALATLDSSDRLVELTFEHCTKIPRLLTQVLGLCMPFCPFLTTLTLRFCGLDGTVLYEIAKFLPKSSITELCLDDSPVIPTERYYYKLLESPKLCILSLSRCSLSDDDCSLLLSKISFPMPASKKLIVLNLTNNFISDVGARSIAECLRSNRTLQYLNLAGNQIGDRGAAEIINCLADFPLTADEIIQKRARFMDFLKLRKEVFNKFYIELGTHAEKPLEDLKPSKKRGGDAPVKTSTFMPLQKGRRSSRDLITYRAQALAEQYVGRYIDPFSTNETYLQDDYMFCNGNMSLCYLNLAYNNLGYPTLIKLIRIVKYQSTMVKNIGVGLLQVHLQGNNMPDCVEMHILQEWLEHAVLSRTANNTASRRDRIKSKK